jgi:hypothetical protein
MVGHMCNATYRSCSDGICYKASTVQLNEPNIIWQGALNGSAEDQILSVTLPLNITLYNTTTNDIYVTTDGVSFLHLIQCL